MRGNQWWLGVLKRDWRSIVFILRSHAFSLKRPKTIPKERRRVFRAPDLQGMLQVLQGEESYVTWLSFGNLVASRYEQGRVDTTYGWFDHLWWDMTIFDPIMVFNSSPWSWEEMDFRIPLLCLHLILWIFIISELIEAQRYWGKEKIQHISHPLLTVLQSLCFC